MGETKKTLTSIKSGAFSRGLALAKVSLSASAKAASHAMSNLFTAEESKPERLKALLLAQVNLLSRELGQLKGSLMKVGQMLSVYGEYFLPPEANAVLKSLQSQSPPLEWKAIERVLKRQLGEEKLALLEINPEPVASASLGQVHLARLKSGGRELAMKVQYPGVDQAIEGDIKALRSLLSVSKLVPMGPKFDEIFREVRFMLHQEVDYSRELAETQDFRRLLVDDLRYVVPEVLPEFSTHRVLTLSHEKGLPVDSPEVLSLSQERRNAIGASVLELYLHELFRFGKVQTDPHFGNYKIRIDLEGNQDQIVLLDFGAVRKLSQEFLVPYHEMVLAAFAQDTPRLEQASLKLGFLKPEDSNELKQVFDELSYLIMEPFLPPGPNGPPERLITSDGVYDWGASDLPKRVARKAAQLAFSFKLRQPPREIVFLDRKLGGMFIFLSVLKVKLNGRKIFQNLTGRLGLS